MGMYNKCVPVVAASAAVLVLGMWNPELLQKKQQGQPSGSPDPKWLALAALIVGLGTCAGMVALKENGKSF